VHLRDRLVPNSQQGILTRITNQHFGNVGFQKIVQPRGTRAFLEAHAQTAAQTMNKLENCLGFGFECGFHHQTSARIPNRRRDRCRMHIHPNILGIIHGVDANNQNLLQSGALL